MLHQFVDILLHLDVYLAQWTAAYGVWVYALLFVIVFAETGLVVAPFLPGDSLLFAVGALASLQSGGLNVGLVAILLMLAAFLGDNLNYFVGRQIGPRIFSREKSLLLNPRHLQRTQEFYREHGAKTVVIARFMPIIRTFAPFVAGVGKMRYGHFLGFSLLGSLLWMSCFLGAGYYFGNLPSVKSNFHIVIFTVIGLSVLPMLIAAIRERSQKKA